MVIMIIAVDGPAGAGKSTISKLIAKKLNINYIDTGAMYRAVTYKCLSEGVDVKNEEAVIEVAKRTDIDFRDNNIYLDSKVVNEEIRTREVSANVSDVAKIKEVRYLMVDVQREIGTRNDVILDGRDIGSYVFPNADYKFFLVATPEERGRRRYKELCEKGFEGTLEEIIKDIEKRDEIDSNREFAPLKKADDAIEIDTTGLGIDEVVEAVVSKIK
nr:(d)CMP kinase [Peptacetobacter hiranonis]